MQISVKNVKAMYHAAYLRIMADYPNIAFNSEGVCYLYEITEGLGNKFQKVVEAVQYTAQINNSTLADMGFTENANVKLLAKIERGTKMVHFY